MHRRITSALLSIWAAVAAEVTLPALQPVVSQEAFAPVQITKFDERQVLPGTASPVPMRKSTFGVMVENRSRASVMAYGIAYELLTVSGTVAPGRQCFASYTHLLNAPMLRAGETKELSPTIARSRPEDTKVRAVLDLVLLDDGTYYGADQCGLLSRFQSEFAGIRVIENVILRRLEKDGLEKTLQFLREQLSRPETDRMLLEARKRDR